MIRKAPKIVKVIAITVFSLILGVLSLCAFCENMVADCQLQSSPWSR
jgi:hypothetical protein